MKVVRYATQLFFWIVGLCLLGINGLRVFAPQLMEASPERSLSPIAVFSQGEDLYFVDHEQMQVLRLDRADNLRLVAGSGERRATGDGGRATGAGMYLIGLSGDDSGNLYLADHGNNRIRKVDSQGIITTVAGIGAAGFAGDGGLAPLAQLNSPVGLVVDRQHNIYISDYGNHRIRKIDNHGRISTLAGTGIPGNSPDGTEATQAQITLPWGIALDCRGQVLFTDLGAQSLKRLVAGKVFTVAKDFDRPTGLAVDCRGGQEVIYISDTNKNQIFTLINGLKRIIAGASPQDLGDSGPALNAELSAPYGLVLDPLGQLIIADTSHNRLRLIDRNGFITTLVAPNRHPN